MPDSPSPTLTTGRAGGRGDARRPGTIRATVRIYRRLLGAGFRRQSTYRLAALGGLTANTTFGLLKVALLFATVTAAGGEIAGYDRDTMSAYIWLSQGLLGSVNLYGRSEIALRIKDGSVTTDFLRPLDVQAAAIVGELGQSLFSLLPRFVPAVLIGALLVGMSGPTSFWGYPLGAASAVVGIVLSLGTVYLIAAAGFWLVETRGLQIAYMAVAGFFAGLFVPIAIFPDWLRHLAEATPFPSVLMYPVEIWSGRVGGPAAVGLFGQQVAWLVAVLAVGQLMTRAGRHKLEVQGG